MTPLEVGVSAEGSVATLRLSGDLDLSTGDTLEKELARLEEEGFGTLVLDLRTLGFMDSSGLRVILQADARAREAGRRLQLVPGPEPVHRVFRLAMLEERLRFTDDSGSAG